MESKIMLITGATSGIGKAAAKALAKQGHTIVVHGRNREKARAVCDEIRSETGNGNVDWIIADLFSLAETKRLAETFKEKYDRLDVLINNAGGIMGSKRAVTEEGLEKTMALNVFSPLLLTELVMDALAKSPSARIINTSSAMHRMAPKPDFDDFQLEKNYTAWRAYALAKLYTIWNTRHLAAELRRRGIRNVTVNALHPGAVATNFGQGSDRGFFSRLFFKLGYPFMTKPDKGAATTVYLAASAEVEGVSGKYFEHEKEERPSDKFYSEQNEQIVWDYCMGIIRPFLGN